MSKIMILLLSVMVVGCQHSSYEAYRYAEYGCRGCNIPEPIQAGKALIYVVADTNPFNTSELHHIYLVRNGKEEYVGSNREAHYCPVYVEPGSVTIKSVAHNTDTVTLEVKPDASYVVIQERKAALSSKIGTKLRLTDSEIEDFKGPIYGKCLDVL